MVIEIISILIRIVLILIFVYFLGKQEWKEKISKSASKKWMLLGALIGLLFYLLCRSFGILIYLRGSLIFGNLVGVFEWAFFGLLIVLLFLKEIKNKALFGAIIGFVAYYCIMLIFGLKINVTLLMFILIGALVGFLIGKEEKRK